MNPEMPDDEEREFTVYATVTLRRASMTVMAKSEAEARRLAEESPEYEFRGAEMSDWEITDIDEAV